jgi:hypothetical protein
MPVHFITQRIFGVDGLPKRVVGNCGDDAKPAFTKSGFTIPEMRGRVASGS